MDRTLARVEKPVNEAHVLESNGIDTLVDARGNAQIRVDGQTLQGGK